MKDIIVHDVGSDQIWRAINATKKASSVSYIRSAWELHGRVQRNLTNWCHIGTAKSNWKKVVGKRNARMHTP